MIFTFYRNIKNKHRRKVSFIILLSFLTSFIIARVYTLLAMMDFLPVLIIRDIHIHHLNFGIFFLAISGFLAFYFTNSKFRNKIAVLYGIGLGLTFDEFALWLHLDDNYWMRQSYDAAIVISFLLINSVFFSDFWLKIFKKAFFGFRPYWVKANNFYQQLKINIKSINLYSRLPRISLYTITLILVLIIFLKIKK